MGNHWKIPWCRHPSGRHIVIPLAQGAATRCVPELRVFGIGVLEGPWMRVGDFPDEYSDGSTGMDTCGGDDTQSIEVWERVVKISQSVHVAPYTLPNDPDIPPLTMGEKRFILRSLTDTTHRSVRTVVEAKSPIVVLGLEKKKESLLEDFQDTVWRERVWPDPSKRGPNEEAIIELKPGCGPKNQGPSTWLMKGATPSSNSLKTDCWKKIEPGI